MDEDRNHGAPDRRPGLSGEVCMGIGIVLIAITMVLQDVLFDGDTVSATGEALAALWLW